MLQVATIPLQLPKIGSIFAHTHTLFLPSTPVISTLDFLSGISFFHKVLVENLDRVAKQTGYSPIFFSELLYLYIFCYK